MGLFDKLREGIDANRKLVGRASRGVTDREQLLKGISKNLLPLIQQSQSAGGDVLKRLKKREKEQGEQERLQRLAALGLLGPKAAQSFGSPNTASAKLLGN